MVHVAPAQRATAQRVRCYDVVAAHTDGLGESLARSLGGGGGLHWHRASAIRTPAAVRPGKNKDICSPPHWSRQSLLEQGNMPVTWISLLNAFVLT